MKAATRKRPERHIGAHVSIAGGVATAPERAQRIGANALGIFTKNQRQWRSPELTDEEIAAFRTGLNDSGIDPGQVLVHASYLINVGNPDREKRTRSLDALLDEAQRVEALGISLLNFHPGSGLKEISEEESIKLIADAVGTVLSRTTGAVLVLEATAGQGAHVGYAFDQLAAIMDAAGNPDRVGVCIDTCHIFAGGYDIRSEEGYRTTMDELASSVGMDRLRGIHVNDSMTPLGSRKDRHERLGVGEIGFPGLARFLADPAIPDVPFILETPKPDLWKQEVAILRGFADGSLDPESVSPPVLREQEKEPGRNAKKGSQKKQKGDDAG